MPSLMVKDFNLGKTFTVQLKHEWGGWSRCYRVLQRAAECYRALRSKLYFPDSRRLTKNGRTKYIPSLKFSINISSARSFRRYSSARKSSDIVQTYFPLIRGIAGGIPLAGPPIQATISGLLSILAVIDQHKQNKTDLEDLRFRLYRLSSHLCNAPTAHDPSEQDRRDGMISILQETSSKLTELQKRRFEYPSVTRAIAKCSKGIDCFMLDSLWSLQMQNQHDIHEGLEIIQGQLYYVGSTAMQLATAAGVALGCIIGYLTHVLSLTNRDRRHDKDHKSEQKLIEGPTT